MGQSIEIPVKLSVLAAALLILLLAGCNDPKSASGFRLPDGEVNAGRDAFIRLNCHRCHSVAGERLPALPDSGIIEVPLGGEIRRVMTYGQLVTSIINPHHIVNPAYQGKFTDAAGASLMPDYNKTMTVDELVNLVAFLQSRYSLKVPEPAYPVGL